MTAEVNTMGRTMTSSTSPAPRARAPLYDPTNCLLGSASVTCWLLDTLTCQDRYYVADLF